MRWEVTSKALTSEVLFTTHLPVGPDFQTVRDVRSYMAQTGHVITSIRIVP